MQNLSRALLLFAFTASASSIAAGEKAAAKHVPAVPGFARFHQAEKTDAEGGRLLFSSLNCAACHTTGAAATKSAPRKT